MKKVILLAFTIPLFLIGFGLSRADKQKGTVLTFTKVTYADIPPIQGEGQGQGEAQGECQGEAQGECQGEGEGG